MAHDDTNGPDRRRFLQAGALATAAAASMSPGLQSQEPSKVEAKTLPTRKLGKTGVEVTMLEQGAVRGQDRILRQAFANGVRLFDTAKVYGTEILFKKWFEQAPEVRKQIFLVTKDMPKAPKDLLKMVDQRLAALGTDYIDLFFIHGLGDGWKIDKTIDFVTCKEFKETADAIRKSGKAKFIGFSTHNPQRAPAIQAAAEAGIVDAIMLQYAPWLDKDSPLNKALDVCWKRGVGLITMKQIASAQFGDKPKEPILEVVKRNVPALAERNLTVFQGLLHAIWTDERISASCVSMRNTDHLRENADAARRYEPLKTADIHQLRDAILAAGPTMCADCDGRCSLAAGTEAELGNITRFLTYHQGLGDRAHARGEYAKLSNEARDWSGADLEAAREACPARLNFAQLLPEAEKHLA
jgi:aryl-alcohol dehydrogenase-like predicted oxidoreductase